jgi:hypothetical protein
MKRPPLGRSTLYLNTRPRLQVDRSSVKEIDSRVPINRPSRATFEISPDFFALFVSLPNGTFPALSASKLELFSAILRPPWKSKPVADPFDQEL